MTILQSLNKRTEPYYQRVLDIVKPYFPDDKWLKVHLNARGHAGGKASPKRPAEVTFSNRAELMGALQDGVLEQASDEDLLRMHDLVHKIFVQKGGPGLGHYGHKGIPGQRGGSLPGPKGIAAFQARVTQAANYYFWEEPTSATNARKATEIKKRIAEELGVADEYQEMREMVGRYTHDQDTDLLDAIDRYENGEDVPKALLLNRAFNQAAYEYNLSENLGGKFLPYEVDGDLLILHRDGIEQPGLVRHAYSLTGDMDVAWTFAERYTGDLPEYEDPEGYLMLYQVPISDVWFDFNMLDLGGAWGENEVIASLDRAEILIKGGPGSGYRGHTGGRGGKGNPGGSTPRSGIAGGVTPELMTDAPMSPASQDYQKGAFDSYKVHIEGDGDGILKPEPDADDEIRWRADVEEDFSFAGREVLSYEVAEAMGYEGLVPVTVYRENLQGGAPASLQYWVEGAKTGHEMTKADWQSVSETEIKKLIMLDAVTGNWDRHGANYLYKDGRLLAIDNGVAFSRATLRLRDRRAPGNMWGNWQKANGREIKWARSDIDKPIENLFSNMTFDRLGETVKGDYMIAFEQRVSDLRKDAVKRRWL